MIPITPKAKQSWRLSNNSRYNPSAKGMQVVRGYIRKAMDEHGYSILEGPLLVVLHFRIPTPQGAKPIPRALKHLWPHTSRPDGDNLEKLINDALNGTLWKDDSQIAWVLRSKSYINAKDGEIILHVYEIKNGPPDYDEIQRALVESIRYS